MWTNTKNLGTQWDGAVMKDNLVRFEKEFVGIVETPGMTYNNQEILYKEGIFGIQVTPLGANLCLLEENVEGEIKAWLEESKAWIKQWFMDIH